MNFCIPFEVGLQYADVDRVCRPHLQRFANALLRLEHVFSQVELSGQLPLLAPIQFDSRLC